MEAIDLFELQESAAKEDYLLNRALDALQEGEPLWKLESEELSALKDRITAILLDRDVTRITRKPF